jgi:hypothetical protein
MKDAKAFEVLRADIRKLFPPKAVRDRWLRWAERIQREDHALAAADGHQALKRAPRGSNR